MMREAEEAFNRQRVDLKHEMQKAADEKAALDLQAFRD